MAESNTQACVAPDLLNANWFPADLHVQDRRYGFIRIDESMVQREVFLDTRMAVHFEDAIPVDVSKVPGAGPVPKPAWLFHTSFCGSTLLARALHLPPYQVCLKEPLVLRRLADAKYAGLAVTDLIPPTLRLLARPWHPGGAVILKPTHVALNIASMLMAATACSRSIILTSSLGDFLVSNLKKTRESQGKIPELVERAVAASAFHVRLPDAAMQPPDLLCAAGLQWAAQREIVHDLVEQFGERLRVIDMRTLLDRYEDTVLDCADWLQLPAPADELLRHATAVATRNAKSVETPYGRQQREQESELIRQHYGAAIANAETWLAEHVIPAMRPAAHGDPVPGGVS